MENYTTEVEGYDVINTHPPILTEVNGAKTWNDADDQDGLRPESITIRLWADGKEIDHVTVTEAENWSWSFTNLPKYRDHGIEIVYTITEDPVENYTAEIEGYDVINTHEPETEVISVTKIWDDEDDLDGIRPNSVTIRLFADGKDTGLTLTLTAKDDWKGAFEDLPVYANGKKIVYTIKEELVNGYEKPIIKGNEKDGFIVINPHKPDLPPPPTGDIPDYSPWIALASAGGLIGLLMTEFFRKRRAARAASR